MSESATPRPPTDNQLLAALPKEDYQRLLPHLEPVSLTLKTVLHQEGSVVEQVYFPTRGMISLVSVMEDGHTVEVGVVGNEGMASTAAFMGAGAAPNQSVVQLAGSAMRMPAEVLRAEFQRGGALQKVLLGYAQALYSQVSQVAACNRIHRIEARLARWLLMCRTVCNRRGWS